MKLLPRSISLRLTVGLSVIALFVFGAAGVLLHRTLAAEMRQAGLDELRGKIEVVRHFVEETRTTRDIAALHHHMDDLLIGHQRFRVWMQSSDGSVAYGGVAPTVLERLGAGAYLRVLTDDGVPMDVIEDRLTEMAPLPPIDVRVGVDIRPRDQLLASYRNAVVVICALGVLLSIGLGAAATWYDLAQARRLSSDAIRITPNSMSLRLSNRNVDKELTGLVDTFNAVLDRLEAAYRQMEAFNADVAHELRTPLTTLISGTQIVLSSDTPRAELREALESNLEDLEQLKGLVNDMLFLARADQGDPVPSLEHVDLAADVDKMLEYFEALLADAHVEASREGVATAMCNSSLIRRAVVNLVSNAVKHSGPGARIVVGIECVRERVRVWVFNPGTPISPDIAARMFDRFFRADEARARAGESNGLGLAIVKAIATMHRGSVFVERQSEGNRIGLEFPQSERPAERRRSVRPSAAAPQKTDLERSNLANS